MNLIYFYKYFTDYAGTALLDYDCFFVYYLFCKIISSILQFPNCRYKDASKTSFKSSTRLECMMQDYPKTLPPSARVGFTVNNLFQWKRVHEFLANQSLKNFTFPSLEMIL